MICELLLPLDVDIAHKARIGMYNHRFANALLGFSSLVQYQSFGLRSRFDSEEHMIGVRICDRLRLDEDEFGHTCLRWIS